MVICKLSLCYFQKMWFTTFLVALTTMREPYKNADDNVNKPFETHKLLQLNYFIIF